MPRPSLAPSFMPASGRFSLVVMALVAGLVLAFGAQPASASGLPEGPFGESAAEEASFGPWISSDKADYAPGSTVTLTGGGWQPGESVHLWINDDEGSTWTRDDDVVADANGQILYVFDLP